MKKTTKPVKQESSSDESSDESSDDEVWSHYCDSILSFYWMRC